MNWFRIDVGGTSRFIEAQLSFDEFHHRMTQGAPIKIARQVVPIPHEKGVGFHLMDKANLLVGSCHLDQEYINPSHIISFGLVDIDSDLWKVVRQHALGEAVIATQDKGVILPFGGNNG